MNQFAIGGIQLKGQLGDNLGRISSQVQMAKARFPWLDMIVLGELASFGFGVSRAETMPGPTEDFFCSLAKKHKIWLVNGSLYELSGSDVYNTCSVINPEGEVVARHRKLFPFLPIEQNVTAGDSHTVFDVPGKGRFGISVCYDMWFPETTRALVAQGAEVIIHPTLTNTQDRNLELSISRATAGINQCYFVDINSCGDLAYGQSIIVGPDGDILAQADRQEELLTVVVDFDRVKVCREKGLMGLGQPLKSFRDSKVTYPQYEQESEYLRTLGPLEAPQSF